MLSYEKILDQIDTSSQSPARSRYARKILKWVACAERSIKWHELQAALGVEELRDGILDLERTRLRTSVKELCGALVELNEDETVEFVHSSAREYV